MSIIPISKICRIMNEIELVNDRSHLAEVVDRILRAPRVAVDIESNGFFRYRERVCLVQLALKRTAFLVDPLAMDDVEPLGELLNDRSVEKVFHDAYYDLSSFDRDWGFRVNNLFDTRVAVALVGSSRLGLQSVVKDYVGIELAKSRKLQRSDWTRRPLSFEALKYAANDVLYLLQVRESLSAKLNKLSRLAWAKEEFARLENVRHVPPDRETAYLSIKGSSDLDERGLTILRSLCNFREQEAKRLDRPMFKVIPDFALIKLSSEPAVDPSMVKGIGPFGRPPANRRLKAAICEGLRSEPVTRPQERRIQRIVDREDREKIRNRFGILKVWRGLLGKERGLDPSLLWPTVSLKRLARHPSSLHSELVSPDVRGWQKSEFSESLCSALASLS